MVADAWSLDPRELAKATLPSGPVWPLLRAEIVAEREATWERDLIDGLAAPGPARVALVNAQLSELDHQTQQWSRVPRVCASISTSSGLLLAAVAMVGALGSDGGDLSAAVLSAVDVIAVGISGTSFCIASQVRADAMVRDGLSSTDKLVQRLDRLVRPGAEKARRGGAA
jgi:hypothetical protein